ncbi:MAG: dolichyl-phosphate-mannose-protein mannosyltransferase family protein 3 [Comamonadaceae bacterium]|nr:MAG: dolichyl-phosphate-mannose-protein mannosyltransferase family protein 3 [Comamonadaceae bacterium]
MATTGDWITPWFTPELPFWGKPPLSFWTEAIAFKLLGTNEFAVRLPSWLATLGSMGLIFAYARSYFGPQVATWSLLIYASCALVFIAAGAVLTDPFLALATTWAMVALAMAAHSPRWYWRYGFFVAMAIGLLAKGPLIGVLVAGPLLPLLVFYPTLRASFLKMPWFSGTALMLLLSVPWYVMAELKTPGFLNYFLVGEHFLRFIDSGWAGDLYGVAHKRMKGAIWLEVLTASFPWGLLALAMLLRHLFKPAQRALLWQKRQDPNLAYLLAWALFTPAFFTLSGNILWTYVLPALASFSVLMALALSPEKTAKPWQRSGQLLLTTLVPLGVTAYMVVGAFQPELLKTEKYLVSHAMTQMKPGDKLVYLDDVPFSATFYTRGQTGVITLNQLTDPSALYLAMQKKDWAVVSGKFTPPLPQLFESREHILTVIPPATSAPKATQQP